MDRRPRVQREIDIGWNHCKMVGNDHRHVICNYCNKDMHGGVTRLKEHLAGVAGDVRTCAEVPKEIKKEIKAHIFDKKKAKIQAKAEKKRVQEELMSRPRRVDSDENTDSENEEDADIRRAMRASKQSFVEEQMVGSSRMMGAGPSSTKKSCDIRPSNLTRNTSVARVDPFTQRKQGKSQSTLKSAFGGLQNAKKYVGRAISKFLYFNQIPHNVANSPYYHTMYDIIATQGAGVEPPTAWEISHTYLDAEVDEYKTYIETFYTHWDEFGCTLMCDGWSTQNRRKIINFLVYSTYGTVFLKSVDATDQFQNGPYIFELMDKMIDNIGEHRVVQVVTDNGANYKSAGQLLMQKRQNLYWTPCAAHCIDLILEDIAKEDDVKGIILQCQKVTGFIYNHGWVLSLMRKETKNRELIRPAITRFATHFLALDSIYLHREDLRRMIVSRVWSQNFERLKPKDRQTAVDVYGMIHGDDFWHQILNITIVFEPLVKVLRMVDNDDKADMGYLYEAMDRAKEEIKKNIGKGYKRWWVMIDKRWEKQLHRDIHAAGYFLNPQFQYSDNVTNDNEVLAGFRHVVNRLESDVSNQIDIDKEVELYRMKVGVFSSQKARVASKKVTPAEWWSIIAREQAPNLTRLAIRILSQTVSSSNCERNWTTFSLIHTKIRNRLTMNNLEKLVFVHYNMRLRERHVRRKSSDDQIIDLDHIFYEEDPLIEWIQEVEDRVLDDRDNPWLDEAIVQEETQEMTTMNRPRPSQSEKRRTNRKKKKGTGGDNDNSSSDDQAPAAGGSGTVAGGSGAAAGGSGLKVYSRAHDTTHRSGVHDFHNTQSHGYGDSYGRQQQRNFMNEPYEGHSDQFGYRHSDYCGGYPYPSSQDSNSQGRRDQTIMEQNQPSPYDNMMVSFLGPDQMQYFYPYSSAATTSQQNDETDEYDPGRWSYWEGQ